MKRFSKEELVGLFVIFLVLVGVSWPNFSLSLRRARDQIRRDDIGNIQGAIDAYYADYGIYPFSTSDGKIVACKAPDAPGPTPTPKLDANGNVSVDMIPCDWGQSAWINLTPGVSKVYMKTLSGDPDTNKGVSYKYFSDGSRYQLYGSLESSDEPGYDQKIADRNLMCGSRTCNIGRANNVPLYITIEEYNLRVYCTTHPKDLKCLKMPNE